MSQSIWTQCAENSKPGYFEGDAWRIVESQHLTSTRKLVDSDEEHAILEDLIDAQKPAAPKAPEFEGLHYLLSTPFRYPPLRHGSRFGRRSEPSIWYGSHSLRTALAEVAYYRWVFLEGTDADLGPLETLHTAFQVELRSERSLDLSTPPFSAFEDILASKSDYEATQKLGTDMREAGLEVFHYRSARDPRAGKNMGVFTPRVFVNKEPRRHTQSWHAIATRSYVEFSRQNIFQRDTHRFDRDDYEVDGKLPIPAS